MEIPKAIIRCQNESSEEILERIKIDTREVGKVKRVMILKKAEKCAEKEFAGHNALKD